MMINENWRRIIINWAKAWKSFPLIHMTKTISNIRRKRFVKDPLARCVNCYSQSPISTWRHNPMSITHGAVAETTPEPIGFVYLDCSSPKKWASSHCVKQKFDSRKVGMLILTQFLLNFILYFCNKVEKKLSKQRQKSQLNVICEMRTKKCIQRWTTFRIFTCFKLIIAEQTTRAIFVSRV